MTPAPPTRANVAQAIRAAATRLGDTSDTARLDAEVLMAHALGCSRSDVLLRRGADPVPGGFDDLVARRMDHEPIAYITGVQEFFSLSFQVSPAVLIPRADSETLVETALETAPRPSRVLDCGTGSGALLLSVLAHRPHAIGIGIDASDAALSVARSNATALGLASRANMRLASWLTPGWREDLGRFDLILANPPYVESDAQLSPDVRAYEPASALFSGQDGLDDYRALVPQLPALLAPGGTALVEIGHRQADAVLAIGAAVGLAGTIRRDLARRDRVIVFST